MMDKEDKSVAMDDVSVVSFSDQSWFLTYFELLRKEEEENSDSQLLEDKVQKISEDIKNIQLNAIDVEAQGSQGVERHSVPLVLR